MSRSERSNLKRPRFLLGAVFAALVVHCAAAAHAQGLRDPAAAQQVAPQSVAPQRPQAVADSRAVRQSSYAAPLPGERTQFDRSAPVAREVQTPAAPRSASANGADRIRLGAADPTSGQPSPPGTAKIVSTTLGSLVVVIGILLSATWMLRRTLPKTSQRLPRDVVEVLGFVPLAPRMQARLIRLWNKLLLVSISADGAETLSEVTDPAEVERLAALCGSAAGGTSSAGSASPGLIDLVQQLRKRSRDAGAAANTPALARRSEREAPRG